MLNSTAPNYKNSHPLVVTLRISRYPAKTLAECIRKWRLERGLLQVDLAKMVGVNEMTILNWVKGRTKPTRRNWERIKEILGT
jgi:ribosome-binding protein aMBF1 (putative translation factor)